MCLLRGTDWVFIYNSTFCPHSVFVCFVWIWEQTAIISLYSINCLVFITETECVYCAVRTGSLYIILLSAHTVYLCVLCGSENKTAIISLYSINWLVFITETECVYCAVRTGSLYIILRSAHTAYLCVLCGSENKQPLCNHRHSVGGLSNAPIVQFICTCGWVSKYSFSGFTLLTWMHRQTMCLTCFALLSRQLLPLSSVVCSLFFLVEGCFVPFHPQ